MGWRSEIKIAVDEDWLPDLEEWLRNEGQVIVHEERFRTYPEQLLRR